MTAYPAWTPASRPGIIPLRPLTFGTILGRSFAALRQNPRVLLGFALCVQTAAYLIVLLGVGAVALASFTRLDTLREGTDEFDAVMAGSIALTSITAVVLGLAAGALGVIVQGVVVSEVAHAAVAEKLTLRALWQRVKPVAWRLVGYSLLLTLAVAGADRRRGGGDHRGRVRRTARRRGPDRPGRARRAPAHAVAVDEAPARARRDHPRARDDPRRDRPLVDAHPRAGSGPRSG